MLSRELMGVFALGILWFNTGLVLAVAVRQLSNVLALKKQLVRAKGRGDLASGTVVRGEPFAVRRISQLGRATTTGSERIVFTDGAQSFEVLGGAIETDDGEVEVTPAPPAASEVWTDTTREEEVLACPSADEFERAHVEASKFKGYARDAELSVRSGDRIWVYGSRTKNRIAARDDRPLVVSLVDPLSFCDRTARLLVIFLVASAIVLCAVTGLALWPPHFGVASTIGGALGLVYFLAIQPLGTAVRDAVKTPARRTVGAVWHRPLLGAREPARD
jgi:hypothetical protein